MGRGGQDYSLVSNVTCNSCFDFQSKQSKKIIMGHSVLTQFTPLADDSCPGRHKLQYTILCPGGQHTKFNMSRRVIMAL